MQRIGLAVLISLTLVGCGRRTETKAPVADVDQPIPPAMVVADPVLIEVKPGLPQEEPAKKPATEASAQEKYDAAFQSALTLLGQGKHEEALQAMQTAQSFQDSEFIRGEISRLKLRVEQEASAKKTLDNIEAVLAQGKAKEGAELAEAALKQFGGTDAAERIIKLKLQADALVATQQKGEDVTARFQDLRSQGEAALKEKNLRAAALAFELALQAKDDAALRKQHEALREKLANYDALRQRAAELRKDTAKLEEALGLLEEAAKAWDTVQVRQEIDEYRLALQNRRDRVSVADFEVRGEVGIPMAGRTIAEEVLPHLKSKYDIVERSQVAKVIQELNLESSLADGASQPDLGKLAKIRYIVLGSVSPLSGVTVNARLVDVQTGLVVQTGKIAAPTKEALMPLLADLAKQLLMTDEEKLAFEEQKAKEAKKPPVFAEDAPLPAPPAVPAAADPFAAPVVFEAAPPIPGKLQFEDLERLPPPPPVNQLPLPPGVGGAVEVRVRQQLLHTVLYVGDNHFRRGRYEEAHRHFEIALQLAPGHFDVRLRLDRCRPLLPPPVVIVQPVPVIVVRPRVAILPFTVRGNPFVVPPSLSTWTPHHLASYFRPAYEVVDPLELYWYMGSLNLTVGDLLHDPWARRWLGRVLNVRYFVFGDIRETASFDVTTFMVDAEYGFLNGTGRIHVHNRHELKLRLSELAYLTRTTPGERAALLAERQRIEALLLAAERHRQAREYQLAIKIYTDALRLRPGSIEILVHLNQSKHLAQQFAFEEARRQEFLAAQARIQERQREQLALAAAAEAARLRAAQQAALLAEEQRRIQEEQQRQAHLRLVTQARVAFKAKNFTASIRFFESALAVGGPAPIVVERDNLVRELALAKAEAARAKEAEAAAQLALREAETRRQREVELVLLRKQAEEEKRQRLAKEEAARKAEKQREQAAYQKAFDEGQRLLNEGKLDAAVAALQSARQVRKTDAVEALLNQAFITQARQQAQAKGEAERQALEKKLAQEKTLREKAEAEAQQNRKLYAAALKLAQKALSAKQYDVAAAKFQEAGKLFRTDEVLTGLKVAEEDRRATVAEADAARKRAERHKALLDAGRTALAAKRFEEAVKHFAEADALNPQDKAGKQLLIEVQTALQVARQTAELAAKQKAQKDQDERVRQLVVSTQAAIKAGKLDAAAQALAQATKLAPKDAAVLRAEQELDDARRAAALATKQAAEKEQAEKVRQLIVNAQTAIKAGKLDAAAQALAQAGKLAPKDAGVLRAQQELDEARRAAALVTKQTLEKEQAEKVRQLIVTGQAAMKAGNLDAAAKALDQASKLAPKDAAVLGARQALEAARKSAATKAAEQKQFDEAVKSAQAALAAKRFDDAAKLIGDALKLRPRDPLATQLLAQAEKSRAETKTAQQDAKKKAEFDRLMKLGSSALAAKRLAEAKDHFAAALKVMPNDPAALRSLQGVNQALKTPPPPPPPPKEDKKTKPEPPKPPAPGAAFQKEMSSAQGLEQQGKYAEAAASYRSAVKLAGADAKAAAQAQKKADFSTRMSEGQKHLQAMRWPDAQREFEAALQLFPSNPAATQGLQKAKQKKN